MWGAASFLFRCARCSGTPVWVRGSRSSRRCPYRVAVPPEGGGAPPGPGGAEGRACGSPAEVGAGGGGGGAAPPPALGPVWEGGGGGGVGGALGPLAMPPDGRGGGAAWQSWPRGPAIGWGVALFPRPPLSRAGFSRRPSLGPLIPRPLSRGAGRPGVAVRVSGQWLASCGAAGSPPRSLSPHSLPREVARPLASCRSVRGAWVGGPSPPPPLSRTRRLGLPKCRPGVGGAEGRPVDRSPSVIPVWAVVTGGSCGARPPYCSVVRVAPARRCGLAGAGPAAAPPTASPSLLGGGGGRPPGSGGAEGRACGSPAGVGAGGGVGGPPPRPLSGLRGGGVGGALWSPGDAS